MFMYFIANLLYANIFHIKILQCAFSIFPSFALPLFLLYNKTVKINKGNRH